MGKGMDQGIIYILSAPRSGSTLLQRLLKTDRRVLSRPESWFFVYQYAFLEDLKGASEFGWQPTINGMKDFVFHSGEYLRYVRGIRSLYLSLIEADINYKYVVEKTPRNILVYKEILASLEGEDRIILLRRQKSEVFRSYLRYFDRFPFYKRVKFKREVDYYCSILDEIQRLNDSRIVVVNYDDIISNNLEALSFLNIDASKLGTEDTKNKGDARAYSQDSIKKMEYKDYAWYIDKSWCLRYFNPLYWLSLFIYKFNLNILFKRLLHKNPFLH